ncbi:MAG: hypothetical protein IPH20_25660, partial [Bacteroidales bacterium]|nr:hypothetical protein [Bacteroidales bacterium]
FAEGGEFHNQKNLQQTVSQANPGRDAIFTSPLKYASSPCHTSSRNPGLCPAVLNGVFGEDLPGCPEPGFVFQTLMIGKPGRSAG